jgi:hypothetical protein
MYGAADDAEGQGRLAAFTQALQQLGEARHRRWHKSTGQRGSRPGRHHSVTVGGIIQESRAPLSRYTRATSSESAGLNDRLRENGINGLGKPFRPSTTAIRMVAVSISASRLQLNFRLSMTHLQLHQNT